MSNSRTREQQQRWELSQFGECPQFSGQSGRRVVKRGERAGVQGDGVLCVVFTVRVHHYAHLCWTLSGVTSGSFLKGASRDLFGGLDVRIKMSKYLRLSSDIN